MGWALLGALALFLVSVCCLATSARAADRVYWIQTNGIGVANLGGGATGFPAAAGTPIGGIAIDPAADRLYWLAGAAVHFANLDGSGGVQQLNTIGAPLMPRAVGLNLDARGGRIYWANTGEVNLLAEPGSIGYANLDGSGGGALNTTGATPPRQAQGLAVHRAAGRLYWADSASKTISYANLDGSGGADLETTGATVEAPVGVAVDAGAERIYWSNSLAPANVASAGLGGGNGVDFPGFGPGNLLGLALDTAANRLYWAQSAPPAVKFANLADGAAPGQIDLTGAAFGANDFTALPVLLKAPVSGGAATLVKSGTKAGAALTCAAAAWLPDAPEAQLYRAAQTTSQQWLRNGTPIPGATSSTLQASEAGSYTCQATATNAAGTTASAPSAAVAVPATLKLGKAKLNRRTGTATIAVTVNGAGKLSATGKGLAKAKKKVAKSGTYKLTIRAAGKAKRKLLGTGKARIKLKVSFTPEGDKALTQPKTVLLKRRP